MTNSRKSGFQDTHCSNFVRIKLLPISRNVFINSKNARMSFNKTTKRGGWGRKLMGKEGPHRYHVTVKDDVIWVIIHISLLGHGIV
jgi:hypothetical protein